MRESAKTTSKTVAKQAEQNRRRELERGFNGVEDAREERIRSIKEIAREYLEQYCVRNRSGVYARYAVGHVTRHLGKMMVVDLTDKTITAYQTGRLKEGAAPKTINEEVGFLLRLLGEAGDPIRARLRRQKKLKLAVSRQSRQGVLSRRKGRFPRGGKAALSPAIYPALMLALNAGMRDAGDPEAPVGADGPVLS